MKQPGDCRADFLTHSAGGLSTWMHSRLEHRDEGPAVPGGAGTEGCQRLRAWRAS